MSQRCPKVIYPPSYWADFHRRRRERAESTTTKPSRNPDLLVHQQGAAYTFTRLRTAPFLSVYQNDGRWLTVPTGPLDRNPPPPRPTTPPKPKASDVVARAQARLDVHGSEDDILLARFRANREGQSPGTSRKHKATGDVAAHPRDHVKKRLKLAPLSSSSS
ncbi:hypothetical protein K438DRAFT_1976122 [Mycena galopus ATCC 62051]|nr:hypothetical protein K438DRAFT_1976122 [Mycena galopus ATCC 62051]